MTATKSRERETAHEREVGARLVLVLECDRDEASSTQRRRPHAALRRRRRAPHRAGRAARDVARALRRSRIQVHRLLERYELDPAAYRGD